MQREIEFLFSMNNAKSSLPVLSAGIGLRIAKQKFWRRHADVSTADAFAKECLANRFNYWTFKFWMGTKTLMLGIHIFREMKSKIIWKRRNSWNVDCVQKNINKEIGANDHKQLRFSNEMKQFTFFSGKDQSKLDNGNFHVLIRFSYTIFLSLWSNLKSVKTIYKNSK